MITLGMYFPQPSKIQLLHSPSSKIRSTQKIQFADRNTLLAQDIICSRHVKEEVGKREFLNISQHVKFGFSWT